MFSWPVFHPVISCVSFEEKELLVEEYEWKALIMFWQTGLKSIINASPPATLGVAPTCNNLVWKMKGSLSWHKGEIRELTTGRS